MIKVIQDGTIWTLCLDRPDKANALTAKMLHTLFEAVDQAISAPATRAIILTGKGKVFSAGADLEEALNGLAIDPVWERLSARVADAPCLTIAALNGTAAGGALGMVLATDIRIAVPDASFFYPVMKLGFLPQPSDPGRLTQLVGPARAKLILMGGARIDAKEAFAYGLVDRIAKDPLTTAYNLSKDVRQAESNHVAKIKSMVSEP